tara:strand:+ start:361 stop:1449 length:1089 start_codon:yes stop_codon:yes gene_type:complete
MAFIARFRIVGAISLVALLGGCTYLPEYVDPIDWADAANEWVTGSILGEESGDSEGSLEGSRVLPGEEDPFPDLESVPDERPSVRTLQQRENLANELLADNSAAAYEDEASAVPPAELAAQDELIVSGEINGASVSSARELDIPTTSAPSSSKSALPTREVETPIQSSNRTSTEIVANGSQYRKEEEFVIPPPAVPEFPEWSSVEEYFDQLFKSSGGSGSSWGRNTSSAVLAENTGEMISGVALTRRHAAVIYFGHGSSKLSNGDKNVLREVARAIAQTSASVRVVGHASSRTKTNDLLKHNVANYETSLARAESVAAELIRQGVPSSRVSVHAVADGQPDYSEATRLGEAGNRRANIYIEY